MGNYFVMEPVLVMVVDDNEDMRNLATQALRMARYATITFPSGLDAFNYLKESNKVPRVIFVDFKMPEMDGGTFIQRVRSELGLFETSIVVTSGLDRLDQKAKEVDADGFLKKPFDLDSLYQIVHSPPVVKNQSRGTEASL
jgi:CheY-like chemotaxis protein